MRGELNRLLAETDLWDHRVGILQVTDAVGGTVRLRALASAVDAPTLFDLRCYLREGLVAWLQRTAPQGLPRTRVETSEARPLPAAPAPATITAPTTGAHAAVAPDATTGQQDARLFTGSVEAMERSRSFTGPGQDVIDEREEHAAAAREPEQAEPPRAPRSTEPRGTEPRGTEPRGTEPRGSEVAGGSAGIAGATVIGGVVAPAVTGGGAVPTGGAAIDDPGTTAAGEGAPTAVEPGDREPASDDQGPGDRGPGPADREPGPEPTTSDEAAAGPTTGPTTGRRVSSTAGTDTATGQTPAVTATPASAPPGPAPITVPGRALDAPEPLAPTEEPPFADTQRLRTHDLAAGGSVEVETGGTMVLPPVPGVPAPAAPPRPGPATEVIATPAADPAPDAADEQPDPAAPPTRRSVRDESRDLDR
jgi:hypothetical protein